LEFGDSPSIVVTFLPPMAEICVWQDRTALPSIWTVQAPQRPEPHPYLVPVSLRCSRTTQSSAVSGCASTFTALPLIVNATAVIGFLPGTVIFAAEPAKVGQLDCPNRCNRFGNS
jgi:hypothetical protein